ncbi:MAG: hypothetical protein N2D54_08410 [Chloroflexota bacterium]
MVKRNKTYFLHSLAILLTMTACNLNSPSGPQKNISLTDNNNTINMVKGETPTEDATDVATEDIREEPISTPTIKSPPADNSPAKKPANPTFLQQQTITDCDTSGVAALGGDVYPEQFCDRWHANVLERPFDFTNSVYFGYLDIVFARLIADNTWIYGQIETKGIRPAIEDLAYAIEFDEDFDGRGDILVYITNPADSGWSKESVQVYMDSDENVGGETAIGPDGILVKGGYEDLIFNQGEGNDSDLAWARNDPLKANSIQIAFAFTEFFDSDFLIFGWRAWVGKAAALTPDNFDIVDHAFEDETYRIDSTCFWTYNGLPRTKLINWCTASK